MGQPACITASPSNNTSFSCSAAYCHVWQPRQHVLHTASARSYLLLMQHLQGTCSMHQFLVGVWIPAVLHESNINYELMPAACV
jgi:hypothetical protein